MLDKVVSVITDRPSAPDQPAAGASAGWRQGPFGGVRWRLTAEGIVMEGDAEPERSAGEPVTMRQILKDFAPIIKSVCAAHRVPAELVITTIAVESGGIATAQ